MYNCPAYGSEKRKTTKKVDLIINIERRAKNKTKKRATTRYTYVLMITNGTHNSENYKKRKQCEGN